jgi:hypothetical protein
VTVDSQPGAWLGRIKDGKLVRHETFTDRDQAFEARLRARNLPKVTPAAAECPFSV